MEFTAGIQYGRTKYHYIILSHANRIRYNTYDNYIMLKYYDRILKDGHMRSGTLAVIKLLEAIRVNTRSIMTLEPYDEVFYKGVNDIITLYIDVKDKDRLESVVHKFSFSYVPNKRWRYWLKRWLLSFEDSDDDVFVERPLFKDTNTVTTDTHEYEFKYVGCIDNKRHEWIVIGNEFQIKIAAYMYETIKNICDLAFKIEGNNDLNTVTESVKRYMYNIGNALISKSESRIISSIFVRIKGDVKLIIETINAYITTHPIEVTTVVIANDDNTDPEEM